MAWTAFSLSEALGVSHASAKKMTQRMRSTVEQSLGALLVSRRVTDNPDGCSELGAILDGWNGRFTVLMRKRMSRHIESCTTHFGAEPRCRRDSAGSAEPAGYAEPVDRLMNRSATWAAQAATVIAGGPPTGPGSAAASATNSPSTPKTSPLESTTPLSARAETRPAGRWTVSGRRKCRCAARSPRRSSRTRRSGHGRLRCGPGRSRCASARGLTHDAVLGVGSHAHDDRPVHHLVLHPCRKRHALRVRRSGVGDHRPGPLGAERIGLCHPDKAVNR